MDKKEKVSLMEIRNSLVKEGFTKEQALIISFYIVRNK